MQSIKEAMEEVYKSRETVQLVRPNGEPVPKHWSIFTIGDLVEIKNYTFMVAYIGESNILFEPVGPLVLFEEEL